MKSCRGVVEMEMGSDGVAIIAISNPPLNALTASILRSLKHKYEEALRRDDVKAIILTGASGKFCGGFDASTVEEIHYHGEASSIPWLFMELQTLIEGATKPSVAAIQGIALGGGFELALCCHARIATPHAQLGLIELELAIIPGFGGTQRLPRLVGLTSALEMMLLSKHINSEEAKDLGLLDAVVPASALLETSYKWALDIANARRPWIRSLRKTDHLESDEEVKGIIKCARTQIKKMPPSLQHFLVYLDIIQEGILTGNVAHISKLGDASGATTFFAATARALAHVFFALRAATQVPGVTNLGLRASHIKKVGVISDGHHGQDIATALVLSKIPVIIKELHADSVDAGLIRIKENLDSHMKIGRLTHKKYHKRVLLVKGTLSYDDFKDVDLVIEAVSENLSLKQQIFHELEKLCDSNCILATTSLTFGLSSVTASTISQHRIIGTHFFSPAHKMPLLELVRTHKTSPQVLIDMLQFVKRLNKIPLTVRDCPGYAVNRSFYPYTQSALLLVDLGVDLYRVDYVVAVFGMPMGPFRLADHVGYEPGLALGKTYLENFPRERIYKSLLFTLLVEDKRFGKRSGKGFYLYDHMGREKHDPEIHVFLEKSRAHAKLLPQNKQISISDEELLEMIFYPIVNESCRILEEGVVTKPSDIDVASIIGMGFPAYRGGVLYWADSIGAKRIAANLKKWEEVYGGFFKPCAWLEHCAARGISLTSPMVGAEERSRL